jgi:Mce-associated membrane protein
MEGDAGTSQLNPTGGQERSDPGERTGGQEQSDPRERTGGQERSDPGDTIRPNIDTSERSDAQSATTQEQPTDLGSEGDAGTESDAVPESGLVRREERVSRGWLVAICAGLLVLTVGVAFGGYVALRAHDQSAVMAREDALALARAKECVIATQAPDVAALTASQSKIIECATGDFAVQANLFTGILVEAYQAANVAVQVSDMHGAVEKHNDDGSVDVLVAVRVKVTNSQAANQEQGYRLRVKMAPADGTYKVARLDQVTS